MSFNDRTDVESILQVPPTPPAATPALVGGKLPFPTAAAAVTDGLAPPPTPVGVPTPLAGVPSGVPAPGPPTLQPTNAPPLPSAKPAGSSMILQSPPATQSTTPLTPGPLISNTQTALQQNANGTMIPISTLTQS
jgi:hypothetical protein